MKTLHIAMTPLAGSPIRIVNALNKHTEVSARLVVFNTTIYGARTFAGDLDWQEDREEALHLVETSDVLHFHHWFDLKENPFGIDFTARLTPRQRVVRQLHSTPAFIAGGDRKKAQQIAEDPWPQLVNAQHPERYCPDARLVPNIVPQDDEEYRPLPFAERRRSIFFAPTFDRSAWYSDRPELRWDTKGAPEVRSLLLRVQKECPGVALGIRRDLPHEQCLRERRLSLISIDDIVTGSYHLSSLEGLSQGVPTFAWLDGRTRSIVEELTGSTQLPMLDFHLEDAHEPLLALLREPELAREIGERSRAWIERYWSEELMIQHYLQAYHDLFQGAPFSRPRFDLAERSSRFLVQEKDDLNWRRRRQRSLSWQQKLRALLRR